MGLGGVAQFIDHFEAGVEGRVISDGLLTAGDIVVDGAGQADTGNPPLGQILGAAERAVAADDYQPLNAVLPAGSHRFLHPLFGAELGATGGIQHGAAPMDDVRHAAQIHLHKVPVDQAVVPTVHAIHLHTLAQSGTDNGPHGGIHARSVPAAGQYREFFDRHRYLSPYFPRPLPLSIMYSLYTTRRPLCKTGFYR